jgi:hypothetical protein
MKIYTTHITEVTSYSKILFNKLVDAQLVKKFSLSYITEKFIKLFKTDRHWILS